MSDELNKPRWIRDLVRFLAIANPTVMCRLIIAPTDLPPNRPGPGWLRPLRGSLLTLRWRKADSNR
jgi:hypothetical protein